MFDAFKWQTSLLFSNSGCVQPCGTRGEIGKHLPCHGVKRLVCCCGFKDGTDVAKVCLVSGSKCKHQVTQHLLGVIVESGVQAGSA